MTASLSPATATRLEKVAVDNGFDRDLPRAGEWLGFASTQTTLRLWLTATDDAMFLAALSQHHVAAGLAELGQPIDAPMPDGAVAGRAVSSIPEMHRLVRRAFQLSRTLPDALLHRFERQVAALPSTTEAERLVVQRVGQDLFREGLIEYWEGRCAITDLAVTELLRASHIKPWASCTSDAERLDVFNGFLLAPSLDAAFDRGFISISDGGDVLVSDALSRDARRVLGLDVPLRVRCLDDGHRRYLRFHREQIAIGRTSPAAAASVRLVRPIANGVPAETAFDRYIGIDYSGAETPTSKLPGLRVYVATPGSAPLEARPDKWNWTRRQMAEWLVARLSESQRTLVGIDHCFSLPKMYFETYGVQLDWAKFLDDFQRHWPTDGDDVYVDFVRDGSLGNGAARQGNTRWRRLTEERAGGAKSAFHFDVPGSVAKSTHAGLPWLRYIREQVGPRAHFWPFDGWSIPEGRSAVVEVYPSLWRASFPQEGRTDDQHDAYSVAAWLREADRDGTLAAALNPPLNVSDRATATFEGWILGSGVTPVTGAGP